MLLLLRGNEEASFYWVSIKKIQFVLRQECTPRPVVSSDETREAVWCGWPNGLMGSLPEIGQLSELTRTERQPNLKGTAAALLRFAAASLRPGSLESWLVLFLYFIFLLRSARNRSAKLNNTCCLPTRLGIIQRPSRASMQQPPQLHCRPANLVICAPAPFLLASQQSALSSAQVAALRPCPISLAFAAGAVGSLARSRKDLLTLRSPPGQRHFRFRGNGSASVRAAQVGLVGLLSLSQDKAGRRHTAAL